MSKILNFIRRPVRYTYWNLNLYLIGTCIVLFILTMISPQTVNFYLGLYPPAVIQNHFYWQFLTYMFMHGGISHLFFNMLALFFFGTPVEFSSEHLLNSVWGQPITAFFIFLRELQPVFFHF